MIAIDKNADTYRAKTVCKLVRMGVMCANCAFNKIANYVKKAVEIAHDTVKDVMNVDPVTDKFRSFGFHVVEINGHDYNQILDALKEADKTKDKPTAIVAMTIKGKGVSYMEDRMEWHYYIVTDELREKAMEELT